MYENQTYEAIMNRSLGRVDINVDKREGSMIYNGIGPAAAEMAILYTALDFMLDATFADTAPREYLILRAAERGITAAPATNAIRRGEFNVNVPVGARFSLNRLNYIVTEPISNGAYRMRCETPGEEGNRESGFLIPIDYIDGLTSAVLSDVLIPGEDEETTEHLRQRYFASLDSQAFGGNISDYKAKVGALDGVGGVKVYPVWNGGGTVKLVIINSQYAVPSDTLIAAVQAAIDPEGHQGTGVGIAPVGHVVTVEGVTAVTVNVTTHISYQDGWDWDDIKPYAEAAVDQYLLELGQEWAASETLVVRISQLETRLLSLAGVLDVADTTLNGEAVNLVLGENSIPQRGSVADV